MEHFLLPIASQMDWAQATRAIAGVHPPSIFASGERFSMRAEELGGGARALLSRGMMLAATSDSPCAPVGPLNVNIGCIGKISISKKPTPTMR